MQQEFHRDENGNYQQLYPDWGTINTNVWLPSLSEVIGITGSQDLGIGCYVPAMQGLNTSAWYCVDQKGGEQFAWFKQFNASGGGEAIMNVCNQQATWLRSPVCSYSDRANSFKSDGIGHTPVTVSYAVHPAVLYNQTI